MTDTYRNTETFTLEDKTTFLREALHWASSFSHFNYFYNNGIDYPFDPFPNMLAVGNYSPLAIDKDDSFAALKKKYDSFKDWMIGYLGYDLKNEIEDLSSENIDRQNAPNIYFYQPRHLFFFDDNKVRVESFDDPSLVFQQIQDHTEAYSIEQKIGHIRLGMHREEYLSKVNSLINYIEEGDCYEINLCQEFYSEDCEIDPVETFLHLCEISPMPFSVLQRINNHYLLCASPERYLQKKGTQLISQPIKGTIKRGMTADEDENLKHQLRNDEKELAENMMIVDLVRNDLAKSCEAGTVKAEELFGIYTFEQLHQMISSVSGQLRPEVHFTEAIRNAFPMGSMTGAPKIKVMELIEEYENSKRGVYSGACGFITPKGDFDFNVVIRSLLYNEDSSMLSFQVGGAITYDSIPEKEYEECLLKGQAIKKVLLSHKK